ncbi:MAG TPA: tetratricopeptide repeat protein [Stellaceae bacterium]|nr:tetratricopeptide repeat protein [Stellaceae bacterium]
MPTDNRTILTLVKLLAGAVPVERDDPILHEAFSRLRATVDQAEASELDRLIWLAWDSGGSETAMECLHDGMTAMGDGSMPAAIAAFTRGITADPGFAEAWNKRATARFIAGDLPASIADIAATLVREPRHYGALAGLGQILLKTKDPAGALTAFEAALAINPHLVEIRAVADKLRSAIDEPPPDRPTLH